MVGSRVGKDPSIPLLGNCRIEFGSISVLPLNKWVLGVLPLVAGELLVLATIDPGPSHSPFSALPVNRWVLRGGAASPGPISFSNFNSARVLLKR